jgi:hypothetical protein
MALHDVAALAKRILPQWVWSPIRKVMTAFLTPIRFSLHTGHFKSSLRAAAVDRKGNPLPWYTYPAIDFVDAKDFSNKTVLEFGSGHSTFWWAKRCQSVLAFESNPEWFAYVKPALPKNAQIVNIPDDLTGLDGAVQGGKFDLIIIDGLDRLKAARRSIELLEPEGAILFDNSEGSWGGDSPNAYPILQLFRTSGFSRLDFYGYAPGVILPHCTSLFFKERSFILRGDENVVPEKLPTG